MGFTYRKDSFGTQDEKLALLLLPDDQFVGTFTPPTSPGSVSVTGVGFQPDCVVLLGSKPSVISQFGGRYSMGVATSDDSDQQWAIGVAGGYLGNPPLRVKSWRPGHCFVVVERTGIEALRGALTSMDADGFTINFDIAGAFLSPTHAVDQIAFLAMQGDFLAGIGTVGSDISGAPFEPLGVWVSHSRSKAGEGVQADHGWQIGNGASSGPDPQFCMTGGALDDSEMTVTGIRSTSYYDNVHTITYLKPANAANMADVAVVSQAKWNSFAPGGVSWFWTGDSTPYQYGYLLTGCLSEALHFTYPSVTSDPGVLYRDVKSLFEPTAMLMTNLGRLNASLVSPVPDFYFGGHGYFSFGAKNPTPPGWLNIADPGPAEEYYEAFAESSGGFGTGGGFQLTQSSYGSRWQAGSWGHASEPGGFPQSRVNVVETFPNFRIVDMMWRDARRQHSRVRTPATRTTAGGS